MSGGEVRALVANGSCFGLQPRCRDRFDHGVRGGPSFWGTPDSRRPALVRNSPAWDVGDCGGWPAWFFLRLAPPAESRGSPPGGSSPGTRETATRRRSSLPRASALFVFLRQILQPSRLFRFPPTGLVVPAVGDSLAHLPCWQHRRAVRTGIPHRPRLPTIGSGVLRFRRFDDVLRLAAAGLLWLSKQRVQSPGSSPAFEQTTFRTDREFQECVCSASG